MQCTQLISYAVMFTAHRPDEKASYESTPQADKLKLSANAYSAWTRKKTTLFSGHYLRKLSTLNLGVLGYIGIV